MRGLVLCFLLAANPAWAIVGGHPPAEDDRRFDAVGAWSRAGWLGLGENPQFEHNWFGGATLIRANMVVTAKHIAEDVDAPAGTYAVRFRRRIDGGLGSRELGVFSYHHALVERVIHGPGDLALAILSEPVTHIDPISVMQMGFRGLDGASHIHAGWGQEGPGREEGPRNQLLLCDQNQLIAVRLNSVTYPSLREEGGPPCAVNRWDSGGAVLVEEQGKLWLLASHQSYAGGPTLAPWLDNESYRAIVHTPFAQTDLAIEDLIVSGDEVSRAASLTASLQISTPGSRRFGGQAPELIAEITSPGRDDFRAEIGRLTLDRNWTSRQRRTVEMDLAFAEDLPVRLYRLVIRLEPNGDDSIARNNELASSTRIIVRGRPDPFVALRAVMLIRPGEDETYDAVHLVHVERRNGSQGLWLFAVGADGVQSFAAANAHAEAGAISLETVWGTFGYDADAPRQSTIAPEGFSGRFMEPMPGLYRAFSGLYHGETAEQGSMVVALTSAGGVIGGVARQDGSAELLNHTFADGLLRAEGGGIFDNSVQGMDLEWFERRDFPRLDLLLPEAGTLRLSREEEPLAPYASCRNRWGCIAHAGDTNMRCYRAQGQASGICTVSGCLEDQDRCDGQSSCVQALNVCAPVCANDEACPSGMSCTFDQRCIDCVAHPELCLPPDAGPPPDTGISADTMGGSDRGSADVDSLDVGAAAASDTGDAGIVAAKPGAGCSCHGNSPSALLWLLPWALRRRRLRCVR